MRDQHRRDERLERLGAFLGEWRLEAPAFPVPAEVAAAARTTFEWTLERNAPDFTPLDFQQRWLGTFSADGNAIHGRWETSADGREWQLDFELSYHRLRGA